MPINVRTSDFWIEICFLLATFFGEEIGHYIAKAKLESSPRPFERPQSRQHTSHVTLVICFQNFPIYSMNFSHIMTFGLLYIRTLCAVYGLWL
jgi:hypothetical protein